MRRRDFRLGKLAFRSRGGLQTLVEVPGLKGGACGLQKGIGAIGVYTDPFPQALQALFEGNLVFLLKNHDRWVIVAGKRRLTSVIPELHGAEGGIVPETLDQIKAKLTLYQGPVESRTPRNKVGGGGELLIAIDVGYDEDNPGPPTFAGAN